MDGVREETGFEQLYRTQWATVHRYAARRVGPDAATDVAAATFATAWRRAQSTDGDGELPSVAWLVATARNHVLNTVRGNRRRRALVERVTATFAAATVDAGWDPEATEASRALLDRVRRTLDDLDAEIVFLTAWEELSAPEIAEVVGLRPDAVRARLSRARRKLRADHPSQENPTDGR
ncbi:MAG TPA: sigma-70 family RNA polymerase sigma factor [Iamia sp.]|nr:sigma-70 family RNA polymerase sigma factor [Iamia sp.]